MTLALGVFFEIEILHSSDLREESCRMGRFNLGLQKQGHVKFVVVPPWVARHCITRVRGIGVRGDWRFRLFLFGLVQSLSFLSCTVRSLPLFFGFNAGVLLVDIVLHSGFVFSFSALALVHPWLGRNRLSNHRQPGVIACNSHHVWVEGWSTLAFWRRRAPGLWAFFNPHGHFTPFFIVAEEVFGVSR